MHGAPFPLDREGLLARLAEQEVSARRGIMTSHRQPAYEGAEHGFVHDPTRPAHRADDAADAWDRVLTWLAG